MGTTKKCSKCGLVKSASEFTPRPDRPIGLYASCKVCKSASRKERGRHRRTHTPVQYWIVLAANGARDRARQKKLKVSLTNEDVAKLVELSNGRCAYCNCALNFRAKMKDRWRGPSLDRIIPTIGYVASNIAVSCYRCNAIKNDATPEELESIARAVRCLVQERKLSCDPLSSKSAQPRAASTPNALL